MGLYQPERVDTTVVVPVVQEATYEELTAIVMEIRAQGQIVDDALAQLPGSDYDDARRRALRNRGVAELAREA